MAKSKSTTRQGDSDLQTVELFIDGKMQTCQVEQDQNGEYVATVTSGESKGRFVKFNKTEGANLQRAAKVFNANNTPADDDEA